VTQKLHAAKSDSHFSQSEWISKYVDQSVTRL